MCLARSKRSAAEERGEGKEGREREVLSALPDRQSSPVHELAYRSFPSA
jgi:hypothetical protein